MKTKEFKIEVPEGYEIDKDKSTFEKIVFKKIEEDRITWVNCIRNKKSYAVIGGDVFPNLETTPVRNNRCLFKNKSTAEAVLALAQLEWLRDEYIKRYYTENPNWKPDWNKLDDKYCVIVYKEKIETVRYNCTGNFLAFPTKEIRDKFLEKQKELIERSKPLL